MGASGRLEKWDRFADLKTITVPTLVIDDRLFWGFDATDMALDYLRGAPVFSSDAFTRVRDVPVGAVRTK